MSGAGQGAGRRMVRVPVPLLFSGTHSSVAVAVHGLVDALSAGRPCTAGRTWLAGRLGVSVATVGRALGELEREHADTRVFLASTRTARTARRHVVRAVGERYVEVPAWSAGVVPARAWRLYVALLWWRRGDGTVGFSQSQIASRLGCSRDVVVDDLALLERAGLLARSARRGSAAVLTPVVDQAATPVRVGAGGVVAEAEVGEPDPSGTCGCGEPLTCGCGDRSPVAVVSGPYEVPTREVHTRGEEFSPAVGELTSVGAPVDERPCPAAASKPQPTPNQSRRRAAAVVPPGHVREVVAVVRAFPAALRAVLPDRLPHRLVNRIAVELEHRTASELATRVNRRWYTHGYATQAAHGRLRNPMAVATALVRQTCTDLRCEDGQVLLDTLTGEMKPCPLCAERDVREPTTDAADGGTAAREHSHTPTPPPAAVILAAMAGPQDPVAHTRGAAACREALAAVARRVA